MGLFSFIKGAGKKVFGKKESAPSLSPEEAKVKALKDAVSELGIPVSGLNIELAEQVIVTGATDTNADREKIILALGNVEGIAST